MGACGSKDHSAYFTRVTVLHVLSLILVEIDSNEGPDAVIDMGNPSTLDGGNNVTLIHGFKVAQ